MAMTVQTNLGALSAQRYIDINQNNMNNSITQLSSGFRINKAADDAAGYAISSKLDAQNARLQAASNNASQATAMVQMADASVNQIQNMVTRLQTLATQAASAQNTSEIAKLDAERSKLVTEINNIATSTNFNGINLLDGTAGATGTAGGSGSGNDDISSVTLSGAQQGTYSVVFNGTSPASASATLINNADTTISQTVALGVSSATSGTTAVSFSQFGITLNMTNTGASGSESLSTTTGTAAHTITVAAGSSQFQVGADNSTTNQVSINLGNSYQAKDLAAGLTNSLTSIASAQTYITDAKTAMDTLTANRADLGATQNQLGFVNASLATSIEQVSSAVSTIKDANMAMTMANFTKSKILVQTGTAMLAQANQASQNVLSLFR